MQTTRTLRERFDLVLTSPPAYPPGIGGSRMDHVAYLGRLVRRVRAFMKPNAYLVLAIQEHPDHPILDPLASHLQHSGLRLLRTVRWKHGDTYPTWVVFMGKGNARLHGEGETEWLLDHPEPDTEYGWLEFPVELVERVVSMTIPKGGNILDPFIGKGAALGKLPERYKVTGIDLDARVAETLPPAPASP